MKINNNHCYCIGIDYTEIKIKAIAHTIDEINLADRSNELGALIVCGECIQLLSSPPVAVNICL